MEAKSLSVVTERTFRSGETPQLKIATRNLEKLTFTAYKIDPETYFRKKQRSPAWRRWTSASSHPTPNGPPRCRGTASSARSRRLTS